MSADIDAVSARADGPNSGIVRYRLDIAYDGTAFHGWGRQPALRTVQGTVEDALALLFDGTPEHPKLVVAGRTDAGVHAVGQVAHLDLTDAQAQALSPQSLCRRLAGVLAHDADVIVRDVRRAPEGFDARFSAVWRRYEYRVADRCSGNNPLERHRTLWHPRPLNCGRMSEAAGLLLGLHDFAAYCKSREGATTIRSLQEFGWRRDVDSTLICTVRADAFCHNMVRSLVGACVAVGEGKREPADLVSLRDARIRSSAFVVVPAHGLTLVEVGYPADHELATRAIQTRGLRVLPGSV